jgi:hypothetical protein
VCWLKNSNACSLHNYCGLSCFTFLRSLHLRPCGSTISCQLPVLRRHGERGPLLKNPYTQQESNGTLTSLTDNGRVGCFKAGQRLRDRYADKIADTRLPDIVNFSLNRVLVSASFVLQTRDAWHFSLAIRCSCDTLLHSCCSKRYGLCKPAPLTLNMFLLHWVILLCALDCRSTLLTQTGL